MPSRPLRADFAGRPGPSDRVVRNAARDAGAAADATQPKEAPKSLPRANYTDTTEARKHRLDLVEQRIGNLEDQRFNAEMDWEAYITQLEVLGADPETAPAELDAIRNAERQTRLRVISLDAALARVRKRKV